MERLRLNKLFGIILASIIGLLLAACHQQQYIAEPLITPYRPISPYQESLLSRIRYAGIQVVRQGDLLRIIIPVDHFFKMPTTQIRSNKVHAIKDLARFVRSYASIYAHPIIQVYGFSDKVYARKTRRQISKEYATVIASYLWNAGISRSRLTVRGLGAQQPIATFRTPKGNAMNRRVEVRINFQ